MCVCVCVTIFAYGWRKCSKSQARSMVTARSGNPLWGLQAWCCIPRCWSALCCRIWWSINLSLEPSAFAPKQSSSPSFLLVALICAEIASLRHRNCFEIVRKASAVYDFADPKPAACSNAETTTCIWWWYCLYRCSTFKCTTIINNTQKLVQLSMFCLKWISVRHMDPIDMQLTSLTISSICMEDKKTSVDSSLFPFFHLYNWFN